MLIINLPDICQWHQFNQLKGIKLLADNDILVKVNIVMIKGINEEHIPAVVKKVKSLGALMTAIQSSRGLCVVAYSE